jgi:hypothetical protein
MVRVREVFQGKKGRRMLELQRTYGRLLLIAGGVPSSCVHVNIARFPLGLSSSWRVDKFELLE